MSIRPPSEEDIRQISEKYHLDLTDEEVQEFRSIIIDTFDLYDSVERLQRSHRETADHPRTSGRRVRRDEDPLNGWITKCDVSGADEGPLAGWTVGIKDNISVAGVEMTCGSRVLEGYVPTADATIVTRLLEAGASIVGKTNMDDMALTGAGFSSAFGPTLNPRNPDHLAGGSSGGSAIVVATGEVDLAIGSDQGGSIRAPASWSGVVGYKPSFGLVPYTGGVGLETTIDHAGPMTRDVTSAATALDVIAGKDPMDPRQPPSLPEQNYAASLQGDVDGLRIGLVSEGFEQPGAEGIVNDHVMEAIDRLADEGATVEEVSVPLHSKAWHIHSVALAEGLTATIRGEGVDYNSRGWYDTSLVEIFGRARRARGADFPVGVKLNLLLGEYMGEQYHSKYYAEAMNLRREFTEQYEETLETYDVLAMPTTPMRAIEYDPAQRTDRFRFVEDAWISLTNTVPFNPSGHPAITVPVEPAEGLPVGLQLVGDHFDDATVLDAGYAVESVTEWEP